MTPLVVVILAAMWLVVLAPPLLRSRSDSRNSSMVSFRRHLSTLQRTTPGVGSYGSAPLRPAVGYRAPRVQSVTRQAHARAAMRRRREAILKGLIAAVGLTGLLGFGLGLADFKVLNLVVDVLLVGYVYLLVQLRKTEVVRTTVRRDYSRAA